MTTPPPEEPNVAEDQLDNIATDLANLREKAGLSLDDMSRQLKLNRDLLQHLERGETEFLGAAAYVRGYLKNYAKILGVDAQDLIAGYPVPDEKTPRINTRYAIANAPGSHRPSGSFLGYLLGTLVVGAFVWGIWYMMSQNGISSGHGLDVKLSAAGSVDDPSQLEPDRGGDFHYSSLLPPPGASPGSVHTQSETQEGTGTEALSGDGPVLPLSTEMAGNNAHTSDMTQATGQGETPPDEKNTGKAAEVVLKLSQPAWVSIRAGDGTRLEHNLLAAGEHRYQGHAPLHFRLGNASNVQVLINGEEFSLDSVNRKNIADFEWPATPVHIADH